MWFHSADGVSGINSNYSDCVRCAGNYNWFSFIAEPGTNSRPYNLRSGADRNVFDIIQNTSHGGEDVSGQVNVIRDRNRLHGLNRLNHLSHTTNNQQDLNLFGDGTNAHSGAGRSALNIWDQGGNTKKMSLGFDSSSRAVISSTEDIRLEPASGKTVYLGDGAWNGSPARLGNYHLWVDSTGDLRIKSTAPTSDTDGNVVGSQS